jgi:tetratricopeptide (TPR) repeat protein
LGAFWLFAGEFEGAIQFAETSLRFSPHGRYGQVFNVIGAALLFSRRFDEALPKLLLAIEDDPSFPTPHRYLAACYAHMGRLDEAREVAARLRSITPLVVSGSECFRNPEHRELFPSGLRMAGRRCGMIPRPARAARVIGASPNQASARKIFGQKPPVRHRAEGAGAAEAPVYRGSALALTLLGGFLFGRSGDGAHRLGLDGYFQRFLLRHGHGFHLCPITLMRVYNCSVLP